MIDTIWWESLNRRRRQEGVGRGQREKSPFLTISRCWDRLCSVFVAGWLWPSWKASVETTLIRVAGSGHGGPSFLNAENRKKIEEIPTKHLK
jgi:hypothetical protein